MKKLNTSHITDSAGFPLLARTLDFIQDNIAETTTAGVYAQMNGNVDTVPVILWGCVGTISMSIIANDTLTITKGAIVYNGEIYQVDAQATIRVSGEVFLLKIIVTPQSSAEPTLYTDGSLFQTNEIRKIKIDHGATGTGICDWINVLFISSSDEEFPAVPNTANKIFKNIRSQSSTSITNLSAGSLYWKSLAYKKNGVINVNTEIVFTAASGSAIDLSRLQIDLSDRYNCSIGIALGGSSIGSIRTISSSVEPGQVLVDFVDDSNNISPSILRISKLGSTFPSANGQQTIINFKMIYKAVNFL